MLCGALRFCFGVIISLFPPGEPSCGMLEIWIMSVRYLLASSRIVFDLAGGGYRETPHSILIMEAGLYREGWVHLRGM
jgi:hypothetical protein